MRRIYTVAFGWLAACATPTETATDRGVQFAVKYRTEPGAETHWCEYKQLPPGAGGEVLVSGARWSWQNAHHWAMYRLVPDAPLAELPLDEPFDCFEPGAMQYAQISTALLQAEPKGEVRFPEGTAFPFQPEEIVLLQTHSLNGSSAPIEVTLDLELTVSDASSVENTLGLIQFYDPYIYVPAHAEATAQMRCKVPQDITLIRSTTHVHERGVRVDSYLDAPDGRPASSPFLSSTDWHSPTVLDTPVKVPQGSYVRTVCTYQGDDTNPTVQGQTKGQDEMCMTAAYYYPVVEGPARGLFENCIQTPFLTPDGQQIEAFGDGYGTGAASCFDTLMCVKGVLAANPNEAPNPGDGQITVGPNFQKCIVDSCPGVSTALFKTTNCVQAKCQEQCVDPAGCQACVTASCGPEFGACLAATCEAGTTDTPEAGF
jgi:hypothetical protein